MDFTLKKVQEHGPRPGPVVVVVMDGMGIGPEDESNAIRLARTPVLDRLRREFPFLALKAHGTAVGLPSDQDMGNSEVGHNALGAGRAFAQGAKLINEAIASRSLFAGKGWTQISTRCRENQSTLHLIGLLSDGNVHSHIDHLKALIAEADRVGIRQLAVHILLDGRDVAATSALRYVDDLEGVLAKVRQNQERDYRIASGGGRMQITMDRYGADWAMVERGWRVHVEGKGDQFPDAKTAILSLREQTPGVIDQDLAPFVIARDGAPVFPMKDGDSAVLFNFRGDRALEISRAFDDEDFSHFDRGARPDVLYAGMMEYDGDYHIPRRYLVEPPCIERALGAYLAANGVPQFACSETQKYGHVTYFWNGNRGGKFSDDLEDYLEIASDPGGFSDRPWMKAADITDATIAAIASGKYRFIRINFPNGDMVGHTGDFGATVLAVETVDLCLKRLLAAIRRARGVGLITADHGNADEMYMRSSTGFKVGPSGEIEPKTSHTLNPVPLHLFDPEGLGKTVLRQDLDTPGLANVAATALELLGLEAPEDYACSLLKKDWRTGDIPQSSPKR